jgi:hypothetical protein
MNAIEEAIHIVNQPAQEPFSLATTLPKSGAVGHAIRRTAVSRLTMKSVRKLLLGSSHPHYHGLMLLIGLFVAWKVKKL